MTDPASDLNLLSDRLGLNGRTPVLGIVLGSGHGGVADGLAVRARIPYADVPGLLACRVAGHAGELVFADLDGAPILLFQGRFHRYEGCSAREVVAPVDLLARLRCPRVMLTTSCGGVAEDLATGDAVVVADHLNFQGTNPVFELSPFDPERSFVDLTDLYWRPAPEVLALVAAAARIRARPGVLAAMLGPVYETPAEVRMLRVLGADAVCMSTVPEAIRARALGLSVAAVALITNVAAAEGCAVRHADVLAGAKDAARPFADLVLGLARSFLQR
jgi:purine-nucleoside phosphorylase